MVICIKPTMSKEKKLKEKEKNIHKKYRKAIKSKKHSRRKKLSVSGNTVIPFKKDVRAITG